jgi:hypothetical protein
VRTTNGEISGLHLLLHCATAEHDEPDNDACPPFYIH